MLSTSLRRVFAIGIFEAGLAEILKKKTFTNDSHIFRSWTERAWVNEDVVYEPTKSPNNFLGPKTHASVTKRTTSERNEFSI